VSDTCYACGQGLPYPPEPFDRAIVLDGDNDAWQRRDGGWDSVSQMVSRNYTWQQLNKEYGPVKVVYIP
jgi:hypothetical protein